MGVEVIENDVQLALGVVRQQPIYEVEKLHTRMRLVILGERVRVALGILRAP